MQDSITDANKVKFAKNDELNKKKNELANLNNEYNNLKSKTRFQISNFPIENQFPGFPNGCEIVSLHMLLKYYGTFVSLDTLANELDKGPAPYMEGETKYGANPENAFVGDPRLTNGKGYGVFQKPITKLANKYKPGIKDITGSSLNKVLEKVKQGHPVQVWASINLRNPKVCNTWIEKESGIKVNWLCGLHSLVIIGFDYTDAIVADPYVGKIKSYSKAQFEKIYNTYGKRAIYYE